MDKQLTRPSVGDVDTIIVLGNRPILRNLKITQCYHDLSQAITVLVGTENVNWCTFATWASKTAGHFIRNDEILALLRDALGQSPRYMNGVEILNKKLLDVHPEASLDHSAILGFVKTVVNDVSGDITTGNLKVFSELGPVFAAMVETFASDTTYNTAKLERFLEPLKIGSTESGGQSLLCSAVTHFYEAMFETNPHRKAEQMLFANAQTGLHEQIRLQPYIAGALNAPIADGLRALVHKEHADKFSGELLDKVHALLDMFLPLISDEVDKLWLELATRFLMELKLPDGTLHLGVDLPALPGQPLFPPVLQKIDDNDLRELLERYGTDGNASRGSGATNWANLSERMRFIVELFRSRQQDMRLYEQPFTAAQREAIAENHVPDGPL